MKRTVPIALLALGLLLFLVALVHAAPEYLDLHANGDDMAPTICSGDAVRVKICTDGSLIKAGPLTSANPGDIIVFCAGLIMPNPGAMWACGRVVSKRFENGEWYLETKLDSSSDSDSWEVPGHGLLGVVVDVVHHASATPETPGTSEASSQGEVDSFVFDLLVGVALGAALGFGAREMLSKGARSSSLSGSFGEGRLGG